jgi:hypothetical protein
MSGNEASREIGRKWKEMSDEERQPYKESAKDIHRDFREKNPDFHYRKDRTKPPRPRPQPQPPVKQETLIASMFPGYATDDPGSQALLTLVHGHLMAQYAMANRTVLDRMNDSITGDLLPTLFAENDTEPRDA